MTQRIETGDEFVRAWDANATALAETYDSAMEHDACGVGLIAALDGASGATWCRPASMR